MTTHLVPIDEIVLADDAVERLAEYGRAEGWGDALLVMDPNTEEAAGSRVAASLAASGIVPTELCFPARTGLRATPELVAAVRARSRETQPGSLLAVGSGVITDVTRYAAHLDDRDFISVPTAASMDGYASGVAAMQRDGVKVTYPARAPRGIFAEPSVLAAAPLELTRAGIGDLLGKATARVDWLAAHLLYGEAFCAEAADRVAASVTHVVDHVDEILRREPASITALASGLIESGIAMAMVGSSRPASGCEHHASHFWDLMAARGRRRPASHGLQVGCATYYATRLQRFAYGGGVRSLVAPRKPDPLDVGARRWLGEPTPEIVAAVDEKQRFLAGGAAQWPASDDEWQATRARLMADLRRCSTIEHGLLAAGISPDPRAIHVDPPMLRAAFRYANRLRSRYTVIDFLEGQDALEEALDVACGARSANRRG